MTPSADPGSPSASDHGLITGAGSGIGAAVALELARRGGSLTLVGRNRERLDATAARCRALGAVVTTATCDVRDARAMAAVLADAEARRPLSLVIANSGIGGSEAMVGDGYEPAELARRVVEVNLIGVINTIAPVQPYYLGRRRGTLVVVGSMAAFEGLAEAPMYAASKAAVRIYGHGLRRLLAPQGIRVSVVTPGFVATPMSASLPMATPFLWSAERAARRIVAGIDRNEPEIAFPWQMRLGVALAGLLPVRAVDFALRAVQAQLEQHR